MVTDAKGNPVLTQDECNCILDEINAKVAEERILHYRNSLLIAKMEELHELVTEQTGDGGLDHRIPDADELTLTAGHSARIADSSLVICEHNPGRSSAYEQVPLRRQKNPMITIKNYTQLEEEDAKLKAELEEVKA